MVKTSIEKLPAYIHYYIRRVIGLNVNLADSHQPCSLKSEKPEINLPMTKETLGQFLGTEFVEYATV